MTSSSLLAGSTLRARDRPGPRPGLPEDQNSTFKGNFGRSQARRAHPEKIQVTFDDVAGIEVRERQITGIPNAWSGLAIGVWAL